MLEAADFHIHYTTTSTASYASRFYRVGERLLNKFNNLHVQFNDFLEEIFLSFLNVKLTATPDLERSSKQSYLKNMRLFEYDPRDNEKRWV